MKTIWKYELLGVGTRMVELPKGAVVTAVAAQGDLPCMWAMVDTEAAKETREFAVYGTGHDIGVSVDNGKYNRSRSLVSLGASHTVRGFVWHVFEVLS